MSVSIILFILLVHWIADFILQTNWQAINKSERNDALLYHTSIYSLLWFLPVLPFLGVANSLIFVAVTFLAHTSTDYITSRVNKILWQKGDSRKFFISVGFDQWLHYAQLFITFKLLS